MTLSQNSGPNGTSPAAPSIRVLVVDDHEIVREGVSTVLQMAVDVTVCGQAGSADEAVEAARATRPDIVLMDVRLGGASGIEATRDIRARLPETKVIMLTSFPDEEALFASIMAGASGYVLKQIRRNDLLSAVRRVAAGESLLDPAVTDSLFQRLRRTPDRRVDPRLASLSQREEQILGLVAQGCTNGEIADQLAISEKTVKNGISRILGKLQVGRRSEAAAYLTRHQRPPED